MDSLVPIRVAAAAHFCTDASLDFQDGPFLDTQVHIGIPTSDLLAALIEVGSKAPNGGVTPGDDVQQAQAEPVHDHCIQIQIAAEDPLQAQCGCDGQLELGVKLHVRIPAMSLAMALSQLPQPTLHSPLVADEGCGQGTAASGIVFEEPPILSLPWPKALSELPQPTPHSPIVVSEGRGQGTAVSGTVPAEPPVLSPPLPEDEMRLQQIGSSRDEYLQQRRSYDQGLVHTIEQACQHVFASEFASLVLVGSFAIDAETPGSNIDLVCFTRRTDINPSAALRQLQKPLAEALRQWSLEAGPGPGAAEFMIEKGVIQDVPVLHVSSIVQILCDPVTVTLRVNDSRPVEHFRWFRRVGAAPNSHTMPAPSDVPLVTLALRSIGLWLRQRQIPRAHEGGLPNLAWQLMVLHACSLPEAQTDACGRKLITVLGDFFSHYASEVDSLDGSLIFEADSMASNFTRHVTRNAAPWPKLLVSDPTQLRPAASALTEVAAHSNLIPPIYPATQLLVACELRRAHQLFRMALHGNIDRLIDHVFGALPDSSNKLPSSLPMGSFGFFVAYDDGSCRLPHVELAILVRMKKCPDRQGPYLSRSDAETELHSRLCDVEENTRRIVQRKGSVVLFPCHFVCRVAFEQPDASGELRLTMEGVGRLSAMRRYLQELRMKRQSGQ